MASDAKKKRRPKSSSSHQALFPVEPSLNSLPSSKADFFRLIAVVFIAAAVAVACNFITSSLNQPHKPFCDTTTDPDESFSDYCEPCPENGVCYDGKLECAGGYRKHGILCIEDGDISKAAEKLSKWVEVHVCETYAQLLCSGTGKCWVSEDELFSNLDEYKMRDIHGLDEAVYMHAKQRALGTIHNLLETRRNDHDVEEVKCPELLVNHYKTLSCVVRQWIIKHALLLVPACALFIGCILLAYRAYQRHHLSVRADQLYEEVCEILEEKSLVSRSVSGDGEPWVVASWLRDHLLSPKERRNSSLWRKLLQEQKKNKTSTLKNWRASSIVCPFVEELIEEDSRVDQYPKLVKGESKVVWEWQVEGSLGSSGKRIKSNGSAPELKKSTNKSPNVQNRTRVGLFDDRRSLAHKFQKISQF